MPHVSAYMAKANEAILFEKSVSTSKDRITTGHVMSTNDTNQIIPYKWDDYYGELQPPI